MVEESPTVVPVALLSGQGKPANEVWTFSEWNALCRHLHNLNEGTRFVMGFRKDGSKQYVRSKRIDVSRMITWAWDSIRERAKSKVAYVPYSQNGNRMSRWGALDFDAHDGNGVRAREFAFGAFRVLLNIQGLFIILEGTGSGGWHVWAITKDFRAVDDWVRLLKGVAQDIGARVEPGICELFPPDGPPMEFGKGVRAPGCWNPSTDALSEIFWHNTEPLVQELTRVAPVRSQHFLERKKEVSFAVPSADEHALYPLWCSDWRHRFSICAPSTRNDRLKKLVGHIFHQVGQSMGSRIAGAQFGEKTVHTQASLEEHLEEFECCWEGLHLKWLRELSEEEHRVFDELGTDNERDAFRIVRSFERKASLDGVEDFPIARDNLGQRLGISGKGAGWIRDRLAKLGAIERTKAYVPNRAPARYRWALGRVAQVDTGGPF